MPVKNPKKITSTPVLDDRRYLEFVSSLQLVGLGLKSSSATLDRENFWKLAKRADNPARRLVETYRATQVAEDFFEVEGQYKVTIADGDLIGLEIDCTFELHMHCSSPVEHAMVERFAKTDLRFILLPYARHFISDITGEMHIPPVVLPMATAAGRARVGRSRKKD